MNPYLLLKINQINQLNMPDDDDSTYELIKRLSHKLQVICSLEALKLILPIWIEYITPSEFNVEEIEAPKKAIETIERWLLGKASKSEVETIAKRAKYYFKTFGFNAHSIIFNVFRIAASAADATSTIDNVDGHIASSNITDAEYLYRKFKGPNKFYTIWGKICLPLIQKELQNKYDLLSKEINGDI